MKSPLAIGGLALTVGCASVPPPALRIAPSPDVALATPFGRTPSPAFAASAEDEAAWSRARTVLDVHGRPGSGGGPLGVASSPDPWTLPLAEAGSQSLINVADLGLRDGASGERCGRSFVPRRPDFRFTAVEGTPPPRLRFYVVAPVGADATLLVSEPSGRWRCNDDHGHAAWGNPLMPAIELASPSAGTYDVWVGAYDATSRRAAVLNVTALDAHHP